MEEESFSAENIERTKEKINNKKELKNDIAITQGTTSTDFTKMNKGKFLQTITSNFSRQSNNPIKEKIISRNKNSLKQANNTDKIFSPLKTLDNFNPKTLRKSKDIIKPLEPEKTQKRFNKNNKFNPHNNKHQPVEGHHKSTLWYRIVYNDTHWGNSSQDLQAIF